MDISVHRGPMCLAQFLNHNCKQRQPKDCKGETVMAEMTRDQQRAELHKAIWRIANDLRGSVDGWDFKQYVLITLFYRYISEDLERWVDEWEAQESEDNGADFSYAGMHDDDAYEASEFIVDRRGYYIAPSMLFKNVCKIAPKDKNLNERMELIFRTIEQSTVGHDSEKAFHGLFADFDPNSNRLGATVDERNKRLTAILNGVASMQLGAIGENKIDLFGDAYEYLMTMYAAGAGKSGGEFFTPQEVSRLLALLATEGKTSVNKVYDPCCGSSGLLLQASKILGDEGVRMGYFGQEINPTTYNLARINMFLHGIEYGKFDIALGDTLLDPQHWDDEPFDVIVSNPPYSVKWTGPDSPTTINDERFAPAGVLAPRSKADFAFLMHMLAWLSEQGTAAVVVFPGILYRGGAEGKIRRYMVDHNFVDAVIQLPTNLFFGTSIQTCVMVLRKNKPDTDILFINAERGFGHEGNKNKLREEDIQQIVAWHEAREDVDYTVHLASYDEVVENDYVLSVGTYVEDEDTSEHLTLPEVRERIAACVAREAELRAKIDAILDEVMGS